MKIAVRMDDISPGMDMEKFNAFYNILQKLGIKPLLGVVPDNQDPNLNIKEKVDTKAFWNRIIELQKQGCIIAMHGYDHIYSTSQGGMFPLNHFSEFAGLSYEEQNRKIQKGKEILEGHGINTDIFMAPAHSYDQNTLRALKNNGFEKVTDGFGNKPYRYQKIIFYPISFRQKRSLKQEKGITTFVVHSNTMSVQELQRWERMLLNSEKAEWISYGELLCVQTVNRSGVGRIWEKVMAVIKNILVNI